MFTPNPLKAQEPVMLAPDKIFTLHLKPNSIIKPDNSNVRSATDTRTIDINGSRTVLLAKAVRWRSTADVIIEFNRDLSSMDRPIKYFVDTQGEFSVSPDIERVSFRSKQGHGVVTVYLEIA